MSLLAHSTLYGNEHTLKQSRMMIMGPKKGREVVTGLRTYRCCLLDSDSHVLSAEVIACSDDEEAKRRALEIVARKPACRGVEIWEFDRRVHSHLRDSVLPPLAATR